MIYDISAYGIFKLVRPKFREIKLRPLGFPLNTGGVSFKTFRFTVDTPAPFIGGHSGFNVQEADLRFACQYDPANPDDPAIQFDNAAWQAILDGPFKDRTFFADPRDEEVVRAVLSDETMDSLAVTLSCSGDPIPGLTLSSTLLAEPSFFIPPASKEWNAISDARRLEREKRMAAHHSGGSMRGIIAELTASLTTQVASFATA